MYKGKQQHRKKGTTRTSKDKKKKERSTRSGSTKENKAIFPREERHVGQRNETISQCPR